MKLNTSHNTLETSEAFEQNDFKIVASSKAFKILSSGLYKNKIKAIIRELSCNAYDAHVAAKCPDKPFDVTLPTVFNSNFSIRDYGTGLSVDDVMELYTTYFSSTKTSSNEFIGALGLGSKSPFSYTDSFSVISYFNGVAYHFNAVLDSQDIPTIIKLFEAPTQEPNGMFIEFTVASHDFNDFERNAHEVFKFFEVSPNININVTKFHEIYDVIIEGESFTMFEKNNYSSAGLKFLQGNIAYPVSMSSVKNCPDHIKYLENYNILVKVSIGTLDVAASREDLSYDETTSSVVVAHLLKIHNHLKCYFYKQIDACENFWLANVKYAELLDKDAYFIEQLGGFNWRGRPIFQTSNLKYGDIGRDFTLNIRGKRRIKYDCKTAHNIYGTFKNDKLFIFNDMKSKFKSRIKQVFIDNPDIRTLIEIKIDDEFGVDDIPSVLDVFGMTEYVLLSEVEMPTNNTTAKEETVLTLYELQESSQYQGGYIFAPENYVSTDDLPEKIYYIDLFRKSHDIYSPDQLMKLINMANHENLISTYDVVGIHKSAKDKLMKLDNVELIDAFSLIKDSFKLHPEYDNISECLSIQNIVLSPFFGSRPVQTFIENNSQCTMPLFWEMIEQQRLACKVKANSTWTRLIDLSKLMRFTFDEEPVTCLFRKMCDEYPTFDVMFDSYHMRYQCSGWEEIFLEFEKLLNLRYEEDSALTDNK